MKIGVVLVTYNRLDKLKIALESYNKQSIKPQYVLVVNNNSTDNTSQNQPAFPRFVIKITT